MMHGICTNNKNGKLYFILNVSPTVLDGTEQQSFLLMDHLHINIYKTGLVIFMAFLLL